MRSFLRSVGAILVGILAAAAMAMAIEVVSSILHPFPPGADPYDMEVCRAHVASYPTWGLLLGAVGWAAAVLVSSWLATRLGTGRHPAHGFAVGAVLLFLAIANMAMLPYPVWFWIFNLVAFPVGCFCGVRLARAAPAPPGTAG